MLAMYSQMMEQVVKLVSICGQKQSSWGGFKLNLEKCPFKFQMESSGIHFKKRCSEKIL